MYGEKTNQGEESSSNNENGQNGESSSGSKTNVPVSPTSTTESEAVSEAVTGAASMNAASSLLALVAFAAAYLI